MKKITLLFLSLFFMASPVKADQAGIDFTKKLADDIIVDVLSADISDEEKLKIFSTDKMRYETRTAPIKMRPPIVGVPCFD